MDKDHSLYTEDGQIPFPLAEDINLLGTWSWDLVNDKLAWSDNLFSIFEILPSELEDTLSGFLKLIHPDSRKKVNDLIQRSVENRSSFSFEEPIITPAGKVKYLRSWGGCVTNADGERTALTGMCLDVTSRKEERALTLHALKQSEDFSRKLVENSPNAILILTPGGIIIYANQIAAAFLKAGSPEALTGASIFKFIKNNEQNNFSSQITSALASGQPATGFEQEFTCMDDTSMIGEPVIIPFEWKGTTAVLSVIHNVTEEKKYIKALQASEVNLRHFIKNTPLAVAMFDRDMNYIACSSKFLEDWWLGDEEINAENIVGLNHYELFHDVKPEWKKLHQKTLKGATIFNEDDFFIKSDGKKEWIRWQNTPWRNVDGDIGGIIIFTEFITERKEAEELIKNSQTKLSAILENLPGMVFSCANDPGYTMTFVSNGTTELTGYEPEEFLQDNDPVSFDKIIFPEDLGNVWDQIHLALKEHRIYEIQYRIRTKTGQVKYLFERGQGIFNENDQLQSLEGIILDISKHKAIEERLRKSEANLAEAQRVSKLGSWEWNLGTRELIWSDEYFRICGMQPKEIKPTFESCMEVIHPDDREKAKKAFDHILQYRDPYQLEARVVRKDGSIRYVNYRAEMVNGTDNTALKIVGSIQDVTDKKEAELALLESESRNKALLHAIPDTIFILHPDGTFADCQVPKQLQQLFHPEYLLGKNLKSIFDHELSEKLISKFREVITTKTPQTLEYTWRVRNEKKYFEARIVNYIDGQVLAIVRDITKNKTDELNAAESERRFYKAFHISPIPITITVLETGKILEVNEKFLQLVNLKREEVIGVTSKALGFWADADRRRQFINALQKQGRIYGFDGKLRTADGKTRDVLLSAEQIEIDGEQCLLLMIFDISERKQAENALISLTEELTTSNHELRQFAYITSHNLRAPVVNIDTLLGFLNRENPGDPANEEILEKIEKSVVQLKSTLNDLIQLVSLKDQRYERDELIRFRDIYDIVVQSLETQITASEAKLNIDFQVDTILFKKPVLESILQNLISNAIKYKSKKDPIVDISTFTAEKYVCMRVRDNGLGIDLPRYKDKLFGMYQRFHEAIEGKGLGLYIIKSQVESMGGKIEVDSMPGVGTTFNVYLRK